MSLWMTNLTQKIESIASETGIVYRLVSGYYHDIVQKEIALAGITSSDRILFIGGGMCPISAILLHQSTGARVTVIDNNISSIPKARQIVNRLGLDEHIRVLCREGGSAQLLYSEYSVVHLALQVFPLEHVFSQVERQISTGTKLLVRRPKRHLVGLYSQFSDSALTLCEQIAHKKIYNIGSTLLYIKQGNSYEEKITFRGTIDSPVFGSAAI